MPRIYIKCFNNGELYIYIYIHHIYHITPISDWLNWILWFARKLPPQYYWILRHWLWHDRGQNSTESHNKLDHEMGLSEIRLCQYAMDDYHDFPIQMANNGHTLGHPPCLAKPDGRETGKPGFHIAWNVKSAAHCPTLGVAAPDIRHGECAWAVVGLCHGLCHMWPTAFCTVYTSDVHSSKIDTTRFVEELTMLISVAHTMESQTRAACVVKLNPPWWQCARNLTKYKINVF